MESIRKGKCLDSSIFNIANQLPPLVLFEKGRPRLLFKLYSFMTRVDHHCLDYYLVKVIALNFDVASFMTFKPNGRVRSNGYKGEKRETEILLQLCLLN